MAVGLGTMNEDQPIIIGERETWGVSQPFGISTVDQRQHIYILGKTGSGKTTLLKNLIIQHLERGHGVGVIDPHGDLAKELLNHIPRWRTDHLVYFNPSDVEFPIAWNPLANVPKQDRHLVASGLVGAFKSIWADSWGPRLEYILYNALAALLECQNVSLLGVNRMLTDDRYRTWVLRQVKDPFIREFWEKEYAAYDTRFLREAIAPIQNKLGQFLLNPVIRNILGQVRSRVSIPFIMDHKQIFIANLSKGKLGADKANLLGSLLVSQFQWVAMKRADRLEENRPDFALVIDEFFNFTTDAFSSLLSEARKYHLSLVLAHQYIDQLSLSVRQAVFGNVGTLIAFRMGNNDAEVLTKEFGADFPATSLTAINRFEAVVKLLENGSTREPFRANTLPTPKPEGYREDAMIAHSRRRFSNSRSLVEAKLRRWLASTK